MTDSSVSSSLLDRTTALAERRWNALHSGTQDRLVGGALVAFAGPVLAIAMWLDPDPAGFGTHRQLGLGGCTVLQLTGWPCPMCGMTTCFTHMAHGQPLDAIVVQPFGVVLFAATVLLGGVGISALAGRPYWRNLLALVMRHEVAVAVATLLGLSLGWVYKAVDMGLLTLGT